MNPLVSFIVPAFNAGEFLGELLESIRAQDYSPYEIIVVDDGSTDNTEEVARAASEVRYFKQANQGAAAARNHAVSESRGEILSFADADDRLLPGKTRRQVDYLLENMEVGGSLGLIKNFNHDGSEMPTWAHLATGNEEIAAIITLVVWREVFLSVGSFNPTLRVASDFDWVIRARNAGIRIDLLRECFLDRRIHSANLSHQAAQQRKLLLHSFKASLDRRRAS